MTEIKKFKAVNWNTPDNDYVGTKSQTVLDRY